jgi:hypothetical protein
MSPRATLRLYREQQVALELRVDRAFRRVMCEVAVYFRLHTVDF